MVTTLELQAIRDLVGAVPDPEVPVLTIADLGIVRNVEESEGRVVVSITPTYSGCPAMDHIEQEILAVLADAQHEGEVRLVWSPAWTSAWMSEEGRRKLSEYGIAPPLGTDPTVGATAVTLGPRPPCPQCGSNDTERISEFASTACKSLHRCLLCREPFDYFKDH